MDKTKYLEAGKHNLDEQNVFKYQRCNKNTKKNKWFQNNRSSTRDMECQVQSFPVYLFYPLYGARLCSTHQTNTRKIIWHPPRTSSTPRIAKSEAHYFQNTHSQSRPQVRLPRKTLWPRNIWNITATTPRFYPSTQTQIYRTQAWSWSCGNRVNSCH